MDTIITQWFGDDERGYQIKYRDGIEISRWLVYTQRYAIKQAIYNYLHFVSKEPCSLQQIMKHEKVTGPNNGSTESIFFNLGMGFPKIPIVSFVINTLRTEVHDFLIQAITSSTNDDIHFMVKTGAVRNWKQNCCICLTDKVGDPFLWGGFHCQITILKPCGHSVCKGCFKDFTTCPLCRAVIISHFVHHKPRWSLGIIEHLTDQVYNKLKYVL